MATAKSVVEYLLDCAKDAGDMRARPMFGEYGLYCNDKVVAFVCDNQLFMKPTAGSGPYEDECDAVPPYPGAKDYWRVPDDKWDDKKWISAFIRDTAKHVPLKAKK
jgi:DNA transformation protein